MEAGSTVNVDESNAIGEQIVFAMQDKNVCDFTFKKNNQAITMHSRNAVIIDGDSTVIDPQLLFQRLILLVGNMDESQVENVFRYELSHRPASIFDDKGFLRSGESTGLDVALHNMVYKEEVEDDRISISGKYIVSGDYLINKVAWTRNQTYDEILNDYIAYVSQMNCPTIVFDTYTSEPTIHDDYHLRKSNGVVGVKIAFTENLPLNSKKESLLINSHNKQRFADMLCQKLKKSGFNVLTASNIFNVTIARAAMDSAKQNETIVTSDDTDLLYVLCSEFEPGSNNVFFKLDGKGSKKQLVWNIGRIQCAIGS